MRRGLLPRIAAINQTASVMSGMVFTVDVDVRVFLTPL